MDDEEHNETSACIRTIMRAHEFIVESDPRLPKAQITAAYRELQSKLARLPKDRFFQIPALLRKDGVGKLENITSPVVEIGQRIVALPIINGIRMPFYISTGEGGKKNVPTSKWYPFFGFGPSGWLNKTTEDAILNFYGSTKLRAMAEYLNTNLGDLQSYTTTYMAGDVMPLSSRKTDKEVINHDMNPVDGDNGVELGKAVDSVLVKLGEQPYYNKTDSVDTPRSQSTNTQQSSTSSPVSGPITLRIGNQPRTFNLSLDLSRRTLQGLGYSDAQFWDADSQVKLQKQPDNTWTVTPNPSATNATIINGRVTTAPQRATNGMTITVGRKDGTNQKTPIRIQ